MITLQFFAAMATFFGLMCHAWVTAGFTLTPGYFLYFGLLLLTCALGDVWQQMERRVN